MQLVATILTHNALEYAQKSLASVVKHTVIPHDILSMDNTSSDGTEAWLTTQTYPKLHVVLSTANVGVRQCRNVALRKILQRLSDDGFVVFLDNDVEVYAGWYDPYLKSYATRSCIGIAAAIGHPIIVHSNARELLPSPIDEPASEDVVSGFCFWVRSEFARTVGFFDEELGTCWHEDDDYCVRVINASYEVFAVPNTQIVHDSHKAGAAEADIPLGGSPENQCYLANKWRKLGFVDAEGGLSAIAQHIGLELAWPQTD
jgi:GT2 family glycosyltransferase